MNKDLDNMKQLLLDVKKEIEIAKERHQKSDTLSVYPYGLIAGMALVERMIKERIEQEVVS